MPSEVDPAKSHSLFYRDALIAEIVRLRVMYEPRPTPWSGQSPEEQEVTMEQWVAILAAEGLGIDEFRLAASTWSTGDGGEYFPSPRDLLALAARAKRGERRAVPVERIMCDGSGWRDLDDGSSTPCGRCNPALAAVYADDAKFARWKDGALLSELDVGVEERKGLQRFIIPLNLDPPCSLDARDDVYPSAERGLEIARAAYANECDRQGRAPSWDHFERVIAVAQGRPARPFAAPGE